MRGTPAGTEGGEGTAPAPTRRRAADTEGDTVYEYELQQIRSAELLRLAARERLVREAARGRRAARRAAARRTAGTGGAPRHRFTRAA
jgi:hypothetical protein